MREGYEPARPHSRVRSAHGPAGAVHAPLVDIAADVSRFFSDLRRALGLSPPQAAQVLATRIDIVLALEAARFDMLPPWPETCRIVRAYAGFAGLDPRPVLHSLEQLHAATAHQQPAAAVERRRGGLPSISRQGAPMLAAIGGGGRRAMSAARGVREAINDRAGRPGMALFTVTMGVALILLVTQSAVLEAAVAQLPPSMVRIVRGAQNYMIVQLAPVRDGLRWIDVPDPRTRRGDKLQTPAQSD